MTGVGWEDVKDCRDVKGCEGWASLPGGGGVMVLSIRGNRSMTLSTLLRCVESMPCLKSLDVTDALAGEGEGMAAVVDRMKVERGVDIRRWGGEVKPPGRWRWVEHGDVEVRAAGGREVSPGLGDANLLLFAQTTETTYVNKRMPFSVQFHHRLHPP